MKSFARNRLPVLGLVVALLAAPMASALPPPWTELDGKLIPLVGARQITPVKARYFSVKAGTFEAAFKRANATMLDRNIPPTLRLPMPDGSELTFSVIRSEVMAPELAARYPMIRTYVGTAANQPGITGRFQMDPRGFRGMVFTPKGTVFIDPYSVGDTRNYQVYYKKDLPAQRRSPDQVLPADGLRKNSLKLLPDIARRGVSIAGDVRTYRLALAATYQYSSFHDPISAAAPTPRKDVVLAEQVNLVNRVSGVYEREVGIRLVLIPNNDEIIFTTPAQPYPDYDPTGVAFGTSMVFANTVVLDALIGSENYDIGHVSSTGGGGVALLGSVCGDMKGGGVTGLPTPVGDGYYIDFVAHEMGHQFGGNHTFNGTTGSCDGNGNAATSFEPGSGITIMAYAGICGDQDIAPHSIDTFHGTSFDEIVAFSREGGGNTCPVKTVSTNKPPTADAGIGGFTLPKQTPFELTAAGCDPDNDAITYQWEEFDLGPAGPPDIGATTTGPLFRNFLPTTSPTRIFPQLSDVLANTQTIGEIMANPAESRPMKFRLTVRDNRVFPDSGGVASADLAFTVTGTAGPFIVTFPDTAQSFAGRQKINATWNVANTTAAPVSCPNVNILMSSDGGNTFQTTLASGVPNDGTHEVELPNIDTSTARLKVKCASSVFFDISNSDFSIAKVAGPSDPTDPTGPTGPTTPSVASGTGRFGGALGAPLLIAFALFAVRRSRRPRAA